MIDVSEFYEGIIQGLQEAIAYTKGENTEHVVVHRLTCEKVREFTPEEIKKTRQAAKMPQWMFAQVIGVSKKSVEAWEGGRSRPDGAARRMIGLLNANPHFAEDVGIIVR